MNNLNPRQVLVGLFGFAIAIFFVFTFQFVWISEKQSELLLQKEFRMLLRSNRDHLQMKNYRAFAETIRSTESDFYLSIQSSGLTEKIFEFGGSDLGINKQCVQESHFQTKMTYCKRSLFPWALFSFTCILFSILTTASLLILSRLNARMVRSFKNLFEVANIPFKETLTFTEAWKKAGAMANQFQDFQIKVIEAEKKKALLALAVQVAHDIRSPVTAINAAINGDNTLSEDRRSLLTQASLRINAIADDLLESARNDKAELLDSNPAKMVETPNVDASLVVLNIIEEKKANYPSVLIDQIGFDESCMILAEQASLERIISNVLQNSIESVLTKSDPSIQIMRREYRNTCEIIVIDNGLGIVPEVLEALLSGKVMTTKVHGNGLGLSYAFAKMKEWKGEINIASKVEQGTMLSLIFRRF